ncbi:uncharacterized protein P174DRAFT_422654 [Aspergillus novofumigatus IBT 16806]|uniref:Uncharacterized protein n=1 Tax=Aspergillus novofumigatus (strain IBT 16806) TaxID=1392255 RepID=A0A2I1C1J6_ASPN1|nr:uncharacterized protein P174DRAFT_422654 [Aspergillus novofumigatus IBT 16806]PKX91492.1 hypothetical protein P174DRAFT_422654 [Aspergillus novofumigatus IBT 16806]
MVNSYGDSKSSCHWGRQKALCCDAPAEQAFLPVDLKDIFPTLPPSNDYVKYDLQFPKGASKGSNPVNTAFGWVLIDGPEAAVTSAKVKRDGSRSDLEFLNCHEIQGEKRQKVRFVCTNDGPTSDCEHMMLDGLAGTIIEMPDNCGAATYAVAHEVSVAEDQSLPAHLSHLAKATVKELTFDYNFGLVKRDAGSIYFRADYANIGGYWETVVDSSPASKRSMLRRFYSSSDGDWGSRFATVRNKKSGSGSAFSKTFSQSIFSGLKSCGSAKAFADIVASGSISATAKMAVSIVGTISPSIDIEEVYSFVDTNIDAKMNLDMSMYGSFNLDYTTESLFSSPITMDEFNHIGIISFAPTLMADVGMVADIELAGNISTGVHAYTSTNIVQNFPHDAGDSSGQTAQEAMGTKFSGDISDAAEGTIKIDLRPRVGLSITLNKYGTDGKVVNAFTEASLNTYNALQVGSDKSYNVSLGTGPATTTVTYKNSLDSFTAWSEDSNMDRVIGSSNQAKVIASGSAGGGDDEDNNKGGPSPHTISNETSSLFWEFENSFLGCSTGLVLSCDSLDENPVCEVDICELYPGLCDDYDSIDGGFDGSDDGGFDNGTGSSNSTSNSTLTRRSSLAKRGAERQFKVLLVDKTEATFKSLPYPSIGKLYRGPNGQVVIETAFDVTSNSCDDWEVIDWPLDDVDMSKFVTEHIVELQTIKAWVQAANSGILPSGVQMSVGGIRSKWWKDYFGSAVLSSTLTPVSGSYAPQRPSDRVFDALGSSRNRAVFVPCQKEINSMKALLWDFKSPDQAVFDADLEDAVENCGPIENFLKPLKLILAVFEYLNDADVKKRFEQVVDNVNTQLQLIEGDPNDYMTKVVKHARALMTSRITDIRNAYNVANPPANKGTVMDILKDMETAVAAITMPYSTV